MADYILLDSPLIENAVKITADVKNAPRRFGRSSLKDTPVVSGGGDGCIRLTVRNVTAFPIKAGGAVSFNDVVIDDTILDATEDAPIAATPFMEGDTMLSRAWGIAETDIPAKTEDIKEDDGTITPGTVFTGTVIYQGVVKIQLSLANYDGDLGISNDAGALAFAVRHGYAVPSPQDPATFDVTAQVSNAKIIKVYPPDEEQRVFADVFLLQRDWLDRCTTIRVCNRTKETIEYWTPAVPIDGEKLLARPNPEHTLFNVKQADLSSRYWGIVPYSIPPGMEGIMIVNGVTPARFLGGSGRYVTSAKGGVMAGNSGTALLLARGTLPEKDYDISLIHLTQQNAYGYIGYFKIINTGWTEGENPRPTFEIVNGYDEEDENCGKTDLPGCEKIPRFAFELPYNAATICLCVFHDENGYRTEFTVGEWNRGFAQQVIGNVYADGMVEQAYVAGGTIYFGRDWFL